MNKELCLSPHYNGRDCYLFVNGVKMYQFITKDSEFNAFSLCFGNISKDFAVDNINETGLYRYVYYFPAYYDRIGVDDILDIHKYLIKKQYKIIIRLIKKVFVALLSFSRSLGRMVDVSNFTTCISLNIQICMTRLTLIYLNSCEFYQALHYYPCMVNLER